MIQVLLVEDQVLLRDSIGSMLMQDTEIRVVGMVGSGKEAVAFCKNCCPDVVLMDIEMPGMSGIKATKLLKEQHKQMKIVMVTTFENPKNIMEAFIVQADGYLVKNIRHKDLVLAIKCVHAGLTVIHPSVKAMMVDRFRSLEHYSSQYEDLFQKKELEIITYIGQGFSNKEIAKFMEYSEGTIKNYITKILQKLGVSDRLQIAIFAIENGIV